MAISYIGTSLSYGKSRLVSPSHPTYKGTLNIMHVVKAVGWGGGAEGDHAWFTFLLA